MVDSIRVIALDLDGTLLNSDKELSEGNRIALERAAAAGIEIVPTTGRFYGAVPQVVRDLPFVHYAITINGAEVTDIVADRVIYRAELSWQQAVDIMEYLDRFPVIYDCFQGNEAFMTAAQKDLIDTMASNPHYRKMLRELRCSVPELKEFLSQRELGVQKVQFFTNRPEVRLRLLDELPRRFKGLAVSSSVEDNVEINQAHANKGEALLALADHLGVKCEQLMAFGDGLNDLSMLKMAGIGVAMGNACPEAKQLAAWIAPSCDEDGVAYGIKMHCMI